MFTALDVNIFIQFEFKSGLCRVICDSRSFYCYIAEKAVGILQALVLHGGERSQEAGGYASERDLSLTKGILTI
jgi:hypothetical protein